MTVTIDQRTALRLQLAMIVGAEPPTSLIEIRAKRATGGMAQVFVGVRDLDRAMRVIDNRSQLTDVYVGAAPRTRPEGTTDAIERVWNLWVDCDSVESVERLRAFHPFPTMVNRSGSNGNLHAWWQLRHPISPKFAQRANRRLALALESNRAATDAARIMRPVASANHKTNPPRPVVCVRLELDAFDLGDVVGGLKDDPAYTIAPRTPPRGCVGGSEALAGLARVVRDAPIGQRNERLNWAAYRAGEHAANGALDDAEAENELLAAAIAAGLSEREAIRTITSGLTAAGKRAA